MADYDRAMVKRGAELILTGIVGESWREDEQLRDTPERIARMWQELCGGYFSELPSLTSFESDVDEMIIVRGIEFTSICAHHMLPFYGVADVGYIPDGRVVGLSKIARVVDYFARRLQIQEEMAEQIADTLMDELGARGVAVSLRAKHMCMIARGVKKQNSVAITNALRGVFLSDGKAREEFFARIDKGD